MLWAVEPRRVPVTLVVIDFAVRWVSAPRQNLQLCVIWRVWQREWWSWDGEVG